MIRHLIARSMLRRLPLIAFPGLNAYIHRMQGYWVHPTARIYSSTAIIGAIEVSIGEHTFVGHEALITGGSGSISIGANCDISDRVGIFCGTHEIATAGLRAAGRGIGKDITIGNGVWIGYGALVLPGVKVGDRAIIAAGTVVNRDVPPRVLVAGNSMRIIRTLE